MRASDALGLLSSDGDGRFHATPLLDTLRKDAPQSLRGLVLTKDSPQSVIEAVAA